MQVIHGRLEYVGRSPMQLYGESLHLRQRDAAPAGDPAVRPWLAPVDRSRYQEYLTNRAGFWPLYGDTLHRMGIDYRGSDIAVSQ